MAFAIDITDGRGLSDAGSASLVTVEEEQGNVVYAINFAWRSDFKIFLIKYQAIKGFLNCDQEIKVNFRRSKILIPVADGSTVLMRVTTPCNTKRFSFKSGHSVSVAKLTKIDWLVVLQLEFRRNTTLFYF